ncbi:hypothetical protein [Kitasatospora sp. NPDC017646]
MPRAPADIETHGRELLERRVERQRRYHMTAHLTAVPDQVELATAE